MRAAAVQGRWGVEAVQARERGLVGYGHCCLLGRTAKVCTLRGKLPLVLFKRRGVIPRPRPTYPLTHTTHTTITYHPINRAGRLFVDRALELGVEPGVDFTRLKAGESVETPDGRTVHAWECVGPARRGRRVAIIGACLDASSFAAVTPHLRASEPSAAAAFTPDGVSEAAAAAADQQARLPCDLLVHSLSYPAGTSGAPRTAAAMAGATAAALDAKELVLWQHQAAFMTSPEGADGDFPREAIAQARAAFGSDAVALAGCYWTHQPERDEVE